MRIFVILLLLAASVVSIAQITTAQQKALNSYVEYANQSGEEVTAVVKSIISYYPTIHQKSSWGSPRYTCPVQLDDYYFNSALGQTKTFNATVSTLLTAKLQDLRTAAEKIDRACKSLDTYHKLEDYKQDSFVKAEVLISELQLLVADYRKKQSFLQAELESAFKKMNASVPENAYHKADAMMRNQVSKERSFLNSWTFNLKEEVHTGWATELLEQSILDTDAQLVALQKFKPMLEYPASSMWTSFQSSLSSMLTVKRAGLDEYNFEAKKSDKHSNDVYLGLINYFNGTLVSDYNMFLQYAAQNKYYGLKLINFVPAFEIKNKAESVEVSVKKFKDIAHTPLVVQPLKTAIPKNVYQALLSYITYINETWSETRKLQSILSSFNSTASYYKPLENYDRKAAITFNYKDFQLPLSYLQKVVADSKSLTPAIAKPLNDQAEVIMNILKEMDDLSASLEIETREKLYERDHLKNIFQILERQKVLFDTWDDKKEVLYEDVR
jgi:Ca-activated chloride channel homolog